MLNSGVVRRYELLLGGGLRDSQGRAVAHLPLLLSHLVLQ